MSEKEHIATALYLILIPNTGLFLCYITLYLVVLRTFMTLQLASCRLFVA